MLFKAEYAHPVPVGMLVELLLVQSLREKDRVVALVGRRRIGEGGDRDGQGPLRRHRRRPLRRWRCRGEAPGQRRPQGRPHAQGAAAGVRHLEAEVSPHALGRHPRHGAPRGDGRGSDLDESAKSTTERVEFDESTAAAALENTAPKVKEHREAGRGAVGVRGKGAKTTATTGAPNPCRLERRATPPGRVTRYVDRSQLSTPHILEEMLSR